MPVGRMRIVVRAVFLILLLLSGSANAYVGPGVGLTAIGSVLAFVGTVVLLLVGFVWYPLKRLIRHIKLMRTGQGAGAGREKGEDAGDEH